MLFTALLPWLLHQGFLKTDFDTFFHYSGHRVSDAMVKVWKKAFVSCGVAVKSVVVGAARVMYHKIKHEGKFNKFM